LKHHDTFKDSKSTHLNKLIDTGVLFKPTSRKATIDNILVVDTDVHVKICDPVTPIFLPKKPDAIDPNRGNNIIDKYII
jgi:hypothetical protein